MDRRDLLAHLSRKAGACLSEHFGKGVPIDKKGTLDLVTIADKKTEKLIVDTIIDQFPHDAILAEEGGRRLGTNGWKWIIDPLDGTTNFAHNFPHFAVSIALAKDGDVVAGVVFDPMKKEYFSAHKGEGATLNGRKLHVGDCDVLGDALAVTGFSYDRRERMPDMLHRVERILNNCRGLRRLGSAALDLAYIAAGRFDVYFEDGLNPWDIAAGTLIVTEAAGMVTDFSGQDLDMSTGSIIACNPKLHAKLLQIL